MKPPSRAMRAALVSGRVRTLSTARAMLARGWIVTMPDLLPDHARAVAGEIFTALVFTTAGEAERQRLRPLPATPATVGALLRGA